MFKLIIPCLCFILQVFAALGQDIARKYPSWVYVPEEKRGMTSAIAYAYGNTQAEAIMNVRKKVVKQLNLHLSNTIVSLTEPLNQYQGNDSCLVGFRHQLLASLSDESIKTEKREMFVDEEEGHFKAILLIDTPISGFVHCILKEMENAKLSAENKKLIKKRIKNIREYLKTASQSTPALH